MKAKKNVKNTVYSLMLPVLVFLFFLILCNATGHSGFASSGDRVSMIYNSIYGGLIALAMSINLTSGRFDFSVGATLVLSAIIGGNIAKAVGANTVMFLLIVVLTGAVIGLVSGLVYVLLGLPPMVVSLGLAMIYEAIGFMLFDSNGLSMTLDKRLVYATFPAGVIVMVIVLVLLIVLWDYTKFGYNRASLASGQKIATDVGVNERKNAVICYIIAGALLGIAAVVYVSMYGRITPETGLSSSSYFMSAFLPMFIGGAIGKYSSHPLGVFIGAITQAFINSGLVTMGASSSLITVLNGVIVMAFLIYTSNSYKLVEAKMFKEKLAKAKAAKAE